ncbi:MAG: primosomal protein N' [Solirubrobacterales bacterium]|nr:primosomal protein N' [Solirubrobacterales bacterium]
MGAVLDDHRLTIARVEPLTRTRAVRGPFDYRLGPALAGVEVGSLLRIPFGQRTTLGVVIELAGRSELAPERLAEPEAVLPSGLPPDLVELGRWMAAEYCSTTARALGMLLAPGAGAGMAPRQTLAAELTPAGRRAVAGDWAPDDGARPLTERQRARLEALQLAGASAAAELGTPALRRLEARGLVKLTLRERPRRPQHPPAVGAPLATPPALTADQQHALTPILAAVSARARDPGRFLLHGVTGSGKTEVYLRAVEATLAAGRGAIVLVPEIALTPQAVARFVARFGDVVAVLHSGLGRGERHEEWLRLRDGKARVCIGPRSAVFAPLADIGLIVLDEEHDGSYKHEGDPRYDARTVALRRARAHGAVLLAGSATPRPESVVALRRLRLAARVDGRSLPPVEVLDMTGSHHPLHPRTRMALADLRRGGGKAIILLNRRGWSNFLSCRSCGHVWLCPDCDVALVLHRASSLVACHHCGHRRPVPDRCPACRSVAVARHGAGTERLAHELSEALGDASFPVFRLDADATAGGDTLTRTLTRFEAAPAGVLVGTQMVAKGHDFPDVTLGVVLDADQTLRFPDFRAEERTFALITQLAGRAGRGDAGGTVLVQTLAPGARSIAYAARHDSDGFLADELSRRRALLYPPFASLVRIVCGSAQAADALAVGAELGRALASAPATVLGPAPLFRLRGRSRSQLVIKTTKRRAAIEAVGAAVDGVAAGAARRGVSISVDVDPQ